MREKKFNFDRILLVPQREALPTCAITKGGQLIISKSASEKFKLASSIIDVVWDPRKRAVGLKRIDNRLPEDSWSKTMRLLVENKNGSLRTSVGKIFKGIGIEKGNYKALEMDEYVDHAEGGKREIYYFILPEKADTE